MRKLFYLLFLTAGYNSHAQVVINEVAHTNLTAISDEDGEYPDWIEIYNAGGTDVNLGQYSITDDLTWWNQWLLPDTILSPTERLIVFASEKNRNAYNAEIASIDHWETAVFDNDVWEYFEADAEPSANWNNVLFADTWDTGIGGFGFGDDDDGTEISEDVSAVYYRKEFEVVDKTKLIQAIVNMDYDDGFVVYLNGVSIASDGVTGTPAFDELSATAHEAQMYDGGSPLYIRIDSATLASLLVNGTNVIAAQVHNKSTGSNDLTGRTFLSFAITDNSIFYSVPPVWFTPVSSTRLHTSFKIGAGETVALFDNTGILLDSISIINVEAGLVKARIDDAGPWCISDNPTPDNVNTGICYTEYSAVPLISPPAGFYTGDQIIAITGLNVKYTTDGTEPDVASADYIAPFTISTSSVIKAKCFEPGKLPSPMITQSIFINEPTLLPVVSISATPCDLFDLADSCLGAYDNVESFANDNPQAKSVIEYFNAEKEFEFTAQTKFEAVGNYSISLDQKGLQFTCDEDFNSPDNFEYPVFAHDKPDITKYKSFRIRNTDNDAELTRMRDLIVNRMAMPTYAVAAGSQNVAAFINGEYWGHYVARERLNAYFCRDNFGCDPDAVDMVKTSFTFGGSGNYIVEAGTDTAFFNLHNYCENHDLTIPEYYQTVIDQVDEQNWADYFATEMYIANGDWMGFITNNILMFRSTSPIIEWKYILWDLSFSQDGENGTEASTNTLSTALDDNNYYADMFNALLANQEYKNYFINRFADLMNYYYTSSIIDQLIDDNTAEMIGEMDAQDDRWNTGNSTQVLNNIEDLKQFHVDRPGYQRDDIESYFGLNGQVDVTIDVNPPGAGYIKISTIMPQTLPWTGIYFDGVPVTLTAIPNPGYTFVDWSDNDFIDTLTNISFTADINSATSFTANFNGAAIPNPVVITEINYNCDSTLNTGDWFELYNTSANEINLTDYTFSDKIFYNDYKFPTGTVIAPNSYLVIAEDLLEFQTIHPAIDNVIGDFGFNLQNDGDSITLLDFSNQPIFSFAFNDKKPWPVTADNYGRTMERIDLIGDPALPASWIAGCVGGSPGSAFEPCLENPLVDEINYNSADTSDAGDWFEIYNYGTLEVDASGWTVKDKNGNAYVFPAGTAIQADSFLVVYQDELKFNEQFPLVENKVGPMIFGLSSIDDIISIYDAAGVIYQSVGYDHEAPYPLSPNGGGTALQIVSLTDNLNMGANWMESCPEGSPGTNYYLPCIMEDTAIVESIDEFSESQLFVYPNPAGEFINLEIPSTNHVNGIVSIYDLAGKEIIQEELIASTSSLNISALTPGIYFIQILFNNESYSSTFIKE